MTDRVIKVWKLSAEFTNQDIAYLNDSCGTVKCLGPYPTTHNPAGATFYNLEITTIGEEEVALMLRWGEEAKLDYAVEFHTKVMPFKDDE